MRIIVDALNGSKLDEAYFARYAGWQPPVVIHVTVNNLHRVVPSPSLDAALSDLADYRRLLRKHSRYVLHITTPQDWDLLMEGGRVGVVLGYQNSNFVGANLSLLELLYDLGVRVMQVTHNTANAFGYGCAEADDAGLTDLGRSFVRACNDLGICLDCSHVGTRTTLDVCAVSKRPVLVTHANPVALAPHLRNKTDEAIRAVAQTGGVVGVTFLPQLVGSGRVGVADIVRHVLYVHSLVGDQGIGFGSDFVANQSSERYEALKAHGIDHVSSDTYPIKDLDELDVLFSALVEAGMGEAAVTGFAGANFARVLRDGMVPS